VNALDTFVANVLAASSDQPSPWAVGKVSAVTVGGGADGADLVTVTWNGTDVQVAHGAHYTPVVGDVVLMARHRSQLAVVMRLVGIPPTGLPS
jgi:hypothetical protein